MKSEFTNIERKNLLDGMCNVVENLHFLVTTGLDFPKPYPQSFRADVQDRAEFARILRDNERPILNELLSYYGERDFSRNISLNRNLLGVRILEIFYLDNWKKLGAIGE
jgi:hypothetical protein